MTIDREPMEVIEPYINPAFFLGIGLFLLCVGGRLLKSAIGLSFGLLGAGVGLELSSSLSIGISPLIIALIIGIVTAILAVSLAKFAILLILAISFAIALPVITWHVVELGDGAKMMEDVRAAAISPEIASESTTESQTRQMSSTEVVLIRSLRMGTQDVLGVVRKGTKRANAVWNALDNRIGVRVLLVGTALAGLLIGLLVATFMPYFSSALITSFAGSFLLLSGIQALASTIWTKNQVSSITPTILVWATIGVALAGLGLQLTLTRKRKTIIQRVK